METVTEKLDFILATKNLTAPIRELGVSLIDEKCYTSLVEKLDFSDNECVKLALSKGFGLAIVGGGSLVKLPQIALIIRTEDATGLSVQAHVLETLSYLITLFYSYRNSFPFSTYGENVFLGAQDIIVSLLTVLYGSSPNLSTSRITSNVGLLAAFFSAVVASLYSMSSENLAYLQLVTLPLSLLSKVPQIAANHKAKSTGQLSAFAVLSQIIGCIARLFTTSTEVGDPVVQAGYGLALLLNLIIGFQMVMYWGNAPPVAAKKAELKKVYSAPVEPVDESLTQDYFLSNGESKTARAEGSSRKWERKMD